MTPDIENTGEERIQNRKVIEEIMARILLPRYGTVTFIIHDGKLVQVEITEKHRLS